MALLKDLQNMVEAKREEQNLSPNEKRLRLLKDVFSVDTASKKEVVGLIKGVIDTMRSIKMDFEQKLESTYNKFNRDAENVLYSLQEAKKTFLKEMASVRAKQDQDYRNIQKQIIDEVNKLESKIPEINFMPIYDRIDALNFRLNELEMEEEEEEAEEEKEALVIDSIDGLREELDRIAALRTRTILGGGVSSMGVRQAFKYIFHTEAPTGDINGVNTTYTVKNPIWAIVGFTLNNQVIAELPNYTFAGNTITFSSPLPSAYSGSDFEIKYIG